jgi:ArsR family transcriptional regulator
MNIKNLEIFDKNRIMILHTLYTCEKKEQICGCDIVEKLDIPKNLLSYHIKVLREAGLIEEEKCGKRKIYQIPEDKHKTIKKALEVVKLI